MKRSRSLKLLISVLIFSPVFFFIPYKISAQDNNFQNTESITSLPASETLKPVFIYTAHNNRDPFSALVTPDGLLINPQPEGEISDIHLEGIIFDPAGKSYAVINGNVIAENDSLGGFTLKEIKKDKIILQNGENSHIIELIKEEPSEQQ
jgi:hypothetical protein